MVCIYCGNSTRVTNSRQQRRVGSVWRRRSCSGCHAVFTTLEAADYEKSWVVQYSSEPPRPFYRDKLLISLYKSCQHRPSALEDATALTATVLEQLRSRVQDGSLDCATIAGKVHMALHRFDAAAATHYMAFHADQLSGQQPY